MPMSLTALRATALRLLIIGWTAVLAIAGCSDGPPKGITTPPAIAAPPTSRGAPPNATPPIDLGAVMRNVHYSFRAMEGALVYRDAAYEARRDDSGTSIAPQGGQPVRFGNARATRGARSFDVRGTARILEDGHVAIGEGVVEHLRNTEEGVEQSWSFASRPEGNGPLTIRIGARGLPHAASTKTGLHFASPQTHLGLRYGHATFVDAEGRRTAIEATWTGSEIALSVPAESLDSAAYPATLDPTISPELGLDNPIYVTPYTTMQRPKVAAGGGEFLVVWSDNRMGNVDVYGARVTTAGTVLDPLGISIALASGSQNEPDVAYDGTNFVVVWTDGRSGSTETWGARVSATGTVLDDGGVRIAAGGIAPAIACGGTNCLVVWQLSTGIRGMRVDGTVSPLDGASLLIQSGTSAPAVAFDGTRYLVVGTTATMIRGARVSTAGVVLDASGFPIGAGSVAEKVPAVSSNGSMFMVVWEDQRTSGNSDIYGARVTNSTVLDTTNVGIATGATLQTNPTIAYDGANFLVLWDDIVSGALNASAYGTRISNAGALIDPPTLVFPLSATSPKRPRVASDGIRSLFVLEGTGSNAYPQVFAARIAGMTLLDPTPLRIASAANEQQQPAMAWDGAQWLVAWADRRSLSWDIVGTRLSNTGAVLDPSGIQICNQGNHQTKPAVASNGSAFYVVWSDARSAVSQAIYGTPVTSLGAPTYANGKLLVSSNGPPALASDGSGYALVVDGVRAYPFASDGTLLLAGGFAVSASGSQASIIHTGSQYFTAWTEPTTSTNYDVWARSMSSAGSMGTAVRVTGAVANQTSPAIAYDGTGYFVVWMDARDGDWNIYGSRLSAGGIVGDPFGVAVAKATGDQMNPRLIFDGHDYLAIWQDGRGSNIDIVGARITTAGVVTDPSGIVISGESTDETDVALAVGAGGQALVGYTRWVSSTYMNRRAFVRFVAPTLGGACVTAADCGGGPCVDSVCCDTTCGGGAADDCQACSVASGAAADGRCGPAKAGKLCRAAVDVCDVAEKCDGTTLTCPADGVAVDGASCDDGLVCNGTSTCKAGVCTAGAAPACDDGNACTVDSCGEPAGCVHAPIACPDAGADAPFGDAESDSATTTDAVATDSEASTDTADAEPAIDTGPDSTSLDSAIAADANVPDAVNDDGAESPDGDLHPDADVTAPPTPDPGCGCGVAGRTSAAPVAQLVALLLLARRRRMRASRSLRPH